LQLQAGSLDLVFFDGNMPAFVLVQRFHSLLAPGGLLVCANLELNGPLGARRAKAELNDTTRWQRLPGLENGLTWVARKQGDAALQHKLVRSGP
jgi:predicted O-methyltransferase YrrM